VHRSSKFTAASFVSHSAKSKTKDLEKIDLLPKIKRKVWIVKDFSTMFSKKEDILKEELGILIEILDGAGYESDSGVHGHRGYKGDYMFHLIGATTPMPYQIWKIMGVLGHRLHFLYGNCKDQTEDETIEMLKSGSYDERLKICKDATKRFIQGWLKPEEKIEWNRREDNEEVMRKISKYAKLMCHLRGVLNIYISDEGTIMGEIRRTINYTRPIIEKHGRQTIRLYNHARGHAINNGRKKLENEDLNVVSPIALSSAPEDRLMVLAYLLNKNGTCTRTDLVEDLKLSPTNAYRTMLLFEMLGLTDNEKEQAQTAGGLQVINQMKLKKEWEWILKEKLPFSFQTEKVKKVWQQYIDKIHS
jgi:predicted transcriptional regulator